MKSVFKIVYLNDNTGYFEEEDVYMASYAAALRYAKSRSSEGLKVEYITE